MDLDKIVQEKLTHSLRKKYITFDGCMLPEAYGDFKKQYDNFEVYEDDIWVCSFPKCGTTWAQEMVWLIANNLDFDGAKVLLQDRFPYLESSITANFYDIIKNDPNIKVPKYAENSLEFLNLCKRPRFIKTHFPYFLLPTQIQNRIRKPKIIYITRDPKDVCVSFYYHSRVLYAVNITLEEFCELFIEGKVSYGRFWDHVLSFWRLRNEKNVLFLKYESMKTNLSGVIAQVAQFLGKSLNDGDIQRLTSHLSFVSMRNNSAVNFENVVELHQKFHKTKYEGNFLRKGIVGDHKNVMSPMVIKKFDEWIKKNIEGTDYAL